MPNANGVVVAREVQGVHGEEFPGSLTHSGLRSKSKTWFPATPPISTLNKHYPVSFLGTSPS